MVYFSNNKILSDREISECPPVVIPAKAGIQRNVKKKDPLE